MRWIIDAQLPPALAEFLRARGHEASHVQDVGLRDKTDNEIWNHALSHGCIIVTKDEDFALRAGVAKVSPPIIWLRLGNSSRRALLDWILPRIEAIEHNLQLGELLIEVR